MNRHLIITTQGGVEVYVNLIRSAAATAINRQPYLISLIREVLKPMKLKGPNMSIERDMGRDIGNSDIVETSEKDSVFYAQPVKQDIYLRCVKSHTMSPSPYLTILLSRDEDGNYELKNAWIGRLVPPFPAEKQRSKSYWETHAWLAESQALQSKTITKEYPY